MGPGTAEDIDRFETMSALSDKKSQTTNKM